jgi:hypothetical protein
MQAFLNMTPEISTSSVSQHSIVSGLDIVTQVFHQGILLVRENLIV